MAEPGVLVCERAGGGYDRFTAQWGGTEAVIAAAVRGDLQTVLTAADWTPAGRGLRWEAVLDGLDYLRTTALVVARGGEIEVSLVLWPGLPTAGLDADPGMGVLARVDSLHDVRRLRHRWRQSKAAVAAAVAAGRLALPPVLPVLLASLDGRETERSPAIAAACAGFCDPAPNGSA